LALAISPYLRGLRQRVGHDLLHVPSVAVMIGDDAGRLLLMRSAETGRWQTVGGALDPDEPWTDAAVREAREETGYEVALTRIIGVYAGPEFRLTYPNGDVVAYASVSFAARIVGGAPDVGGDETAELAWLTEAETFSLALEPHTRILVTDAFRPEGPAHFGYPARGAGAGS
jgi:8-oxo-dGTP pyrophosphatase MutT (NUDIX family)